MSAAPVAVLSGCRSRSLRSILCEACFRGICYSPARKKGLAPFGPDRFLRKFVAGGGNPVTSGGGSQVSNGAECAVLSKAGCFGPEVARKFVG